MFPEEPQLYLTIEKGQITYEDEFPATKTFSKLHNSDEEFVRGPVKALLAQNNATDLHSWDAGSTGAANSCETASPKLVMRTKKNKPAPTPPTAFKVERVGQDASKVGKEKNNGERLHHLQQQQQDFLASEADFRRRSVEGDGFSAVDGRHEARSAGRLPGNCFFVEFCAFFGYFYCTSFCTSLVCYICRFLFKFIRF